MRGQKGSTFEGGVRSPCFIHYPEKIEPETTVRRVGAAIDLLPTLADLAGVKISGGKSLDGISLCPSLEGQEPSVDRFLFSAWNGKTTARSQQYRYQSSGELFDIENDPREQNNIAAEQAEVARWHQLALKQWQQANSIKRSNVNEDRPFVLGHPDAVWTQMPARDATPTGAIERSNRYPNCTFMQNWTDTQSSIEWDVEVPAGGI